MRLGLLGAVTAEEALAAAKNGQANAKVMTDYVDHPADNGFPGFTAIWDRVWGALPGILSPSSNIASTTPVLLPQAASQNAAPILLAALAVGGFMLLKSGKRARR